jgi:hypothetical protein
MSRFGYALRTAEREAIGKAFHLFDKKVDDILALIVGKGLDEKRRALAGLQTRIGGLDIPRAEDVAASAFLGSLVDTKELQLAICNDQAAFEEA